MSRKRDRPYSHQIRSFDTLFGESAPAEAGEAIPLTIIRLPLRQPRRYFAPEQMEQLIASVKQHGILEPLLVRPLHDGEYELVAGERRYRAAQASGLETVPVTIRDLDDEEALQLSLIENLQRQDLNPYEEVEAILQLLALQLGQSLEQVTALLYRLEKEQAGKAAHNVMGGSEEEVVTTTFAALGKRLNSFVKNRLPLLKLPEDIQKALQRGDLAYTKAQAIARVADEQARATLLNTAIADQLSLSDIRQHIAQQAPPPAAPKPPAEDTSWERRIERALRQTKHSRIWEDPTKKRRLEKLLSQIEALTSEKRVDEKGKTE